MKIFTSIKNLVYYIRKEKITKLFLAVFFTVLIGAGLVFVSEKLSNSTAFSNFADAVWWAVVTVTSVGYGDIYPHMPVGRIIAGILMFFGITLISILSGTVASIIVDRKLREGRGLEDIKFKRHTLICGWNQNAEKILQEFNSIPSMKDAGIVLINEINPEDFQLLKTKYPALDLHFVRGDFVNENVLKKAGSEFAKNAILLADATRRPELGSPDERTILAALALNALNNTITISAEIINATNEQHLRRANVDNILVYGEFNAYLFSTSAREEGIPLLVKEILSNKNRNSIHQLEIPAQFVGKKFQDLHEYFMKSQKGILIGFISQEKKMTLDDILSEDSSAIDDFIKRKFHEAEIDIVGEEKAEIDVKINPGLDYVIGENDSAFIIGTGTGG
ncbi:MAG: NAD-binding protein [Spirochaetales bacterium]|nr:NAD-binding protein [Spirochaetales bacterium]